MSRSQFATAVTATLRELERRVGITRPRARIALARTVLHRVGRRLLAERDLRLFCMGCGARAASLHACGRCGSLEGYEFRSAPRSRAVRGAA